MLNRKESFSSPFRGPVNRSRGPFVHSQVSWCCPVPRPRHPSHNAEKCFGLAQSQRVQLAWKQVHGKSSETLCVCFALNPSPARASARTGVVLSWFELWVSWTHQSHRRFQQPQPLFLRRKRWRLRPPALQVSATGRTTAEVEGTRELNSWGRARVGITSGNLTTNPRTVMWVISKKGARTFEESLGSRVVL